MFDISLLALAYPAPHAATYMAYAPPHGDPFATRRELELERSGNGATQHRPRHSHNLCKPLSAEWRTWGGAARQVEGGE